MAQGLEAEVGTEGAFQLERLKWFLSRPEQAADDEGRVRPQTSGPNATWIPNHGQRSRSGEAISNAFVESAVNQVVSKRIVKKQRIRWSPEDAHFLLQVRTRVLATDLAGEVRRRYPPSCRRPDRQDQRCELPRLSRSPFARNLRGFARALPGSGSPLRAATKSSARQSRRH
jgi:hypothetical protein